MLPIRHHEHDVKFIKEQLNKIPSTMTKEVCGKYSAAFRDAYDKEPNYVKKENAARREANTRLRVFAKKVQERIQW